MTDGISRENALKLRDLFAEYKSNMRDQQRTLADLLKLCLEVIEVDNGHPLSWLEQQKRIANRNALRKKLPHVLRETIKMLEKE